MHHWNDEWFQKHGDDLNAAISYCTHIWRRYGRIGTAFSKEKHGIFNHNVRFYSGEWPIHELVNPGYVYYRGTKWMMTAERALGKVLVRLRLVWIVGKYQEAIYNYAIQQACKKHPEIIVELVGGSDYPELIRPGIFGEVDGKKLHENVWSKG